MDRNSPAGSRRFEHAREESSFARIFSCIRFVRGNNGILSAQVAVLPSHPVYYTLIKFWFDLSFHYTNYNIHDTVSDHCYNSVLFFFMVINIKIKKSLKYTLKSMNEFFFYI